MEHFRSDNDLYRWRAFGGIAVPLTTLSLGVPTAFGVPFRYSPAALIPAALLAGVFLVRARHDRRLGRRSSDYNAGDPD